ncbi:MAG: hypothetical protein JNM40_08060 [Myxococcales bacterium]|nr:hypothetical protein [Myxococcales bacterium]
MIHGTAGAPTKKRKCPRCGHTQLVSILLKQETVTCRRCGGMIPAPPTTQPRETKHK